MQRHILSHFYSLLNLTQRTVINYQYRYGSTFLQALTTLYGMGKSTNISSLLLLEMYFILQTSTIYLKSTYATLLYITCTKMKGGIPRLYSGISFALIQAPISRFISTAANDGVSVLLQNFNCGPGDLSTSCCFCVYSDLCVCFHDVSSSHVYCISPT